MLLLFGVKKIYNWSLTVDASFIIHLYFVKIEPGSTNMQTRAGQKVGGVLTPGPQRDWRHCPCWFERWRHSIANCCRMVTDSAMVTTESLTTIALSNGTIADPLLPPFPHMGSHYAPMIREWPYLRNWSCYPVHFILRFYGRVFRASILYNTHHVRGHLCDSTAFLFSGPDVFK